MQFDRLVGRNVFGAIAPTPDLIRAIVAGLRSSGQLALAETVPRDSQRLWSLVPADKLTGKLAERWRKAEAALYREDQDARFAWNGEQLAQMLEKSGTLHHLVTGAGAERSVRQ